MYYLLFNKVKNYELVRQFFYFLDLLDKNTIENPQPFVLLCIRKPLLDKL